MAAFPQNLSPELNSYILSQDQDIKTLRKGLAEANKAILLIRDNNKSDIRKLKLQIQGLVT